MSFINDDFSASGAALYLLEEWKLGAGYTHEVEKEQLLNQQAEYYLRIELPGKLRFGSCSGSFHQ